MLYLHLYLKALEEEMAVAQHIPGLEPTQVLPEQHFDLPDELRNSLHRASDLIRKRRMELREDPLPTSLAGLDHLLGGGLPRGELVEFVGRGSCGRFAALLATLRAVTGAGEAAALVDQGAQLDPQTAAEIGVDLERLLWLRPQNLGDSLAATELLVHTGFPLVALDLGLPPVRGRAPLAAWLRVARNAATHQAVVLVGTPYRLSGCAAGVVVAAGRGRGDWSSGGAFRLLNGLRAWLHLARRIGHPDHETAPNVLTLPEAAFENSEFPTTQPGSSAPSEIENERRNEHVTAL
jgi:hypothetical protein